MWFDRPSRLDRLRQAAREALNAYRAIGLGPAGWSARDRDAFAVLAYLLDTLDRKPSLLSRIRAWL